MPGRSWLSRWVNHPSYWVEVVLYAVIGVLLVAVSFAVFG
jgi:hypothetical protein